MSIELMLNAVNINLVAFGAALHDLTGQVFALFVITVAAAEVGIGLAIVILIYLIQGAFDWDAARIDPVEGSVAAVGSSIFSRFVLPFEVISFLLLAALIGAIVLSRKEDRP